jgi:hypothetical protein
MIQHNKVGKQLSRTDLQKIKGGEAKSFGCRLDVCTRTQPCCPGLICALLPIAGTDIRGTCTNWGDFDN